MKKDSLFQILSYVMVSVLAVGAAFAISVKFIGRSRAQNGEPAQPAATVAPVMQKPAASTESAAAVAAEVQGFLEPFIYDSKNRRDPFQVYADFRPAENVNLAALNPLQRYELDELHLIGVMWDVHNPKAMFVDPEKVVHVVGRDESIGKHNGYIATIREGEVVVVESIRVKGSSQITFQPHVIRMER
jgi:type IV pilus assembly protein PilP